MPRTLLEKHPHIVSDMIGVDPWKQLLTSRKIDEIFLKTCSLSDLHDPFLMPDMQVFCDRILLAKKNNERVMIFGDYDVDGISSTAALFLFLQDEM